MNTISYKGNDKLLFGIILGVLAFWLFAQTTLNINVDMAKDLQLILRAVYLTTYVIRFEGRQDNIAIRQAAIIALLFNLLMVVVAIIAIMKTIPKSKEK